MNYLQPCIDELEGVERDLDRLAPSDKDPHRYHELKSELRERLRKVVLMLRGDYSIDRPAPSRRRRRNAFVTGLPDPDRKVIDARQRFRPEPAG